MTTYGWTEGPVATPVLVAFGQPQAQRRWTVFLRPLLVIPHYVVLAFLGIAAGFVVLVGWFAALVLGRLPAPMADFVTGFLRWDIRVRSYIFLLTDQYPPFTMAPVERYPVDLVVGGSRLNRWSVLFRVILAVPAAIVAGVAGYGIGIFWLVTWVVTLCAGRTPGAFWGANAAIIRYLVRYAGWMTMLTSVYPSGLLGDGHDPYGGPYGNANGGPYGPLPGGTAPGQWRAPPAWPTAPGVPSPGPEGSSPRVDVGVAQPDLPAPPPFVAPTQHQPLPALSGFAPLVTTPAPAPTDAPDAGPTVPDEPGPDVPTTSDQGRHPGAPDAVPEWSPPPVSPDLFPSGAASVPAPPPPSPAGSAGAPPPQPTAPPPPTAPPGPWAPPPGPVPISSDGRWRLVLTGGARGLAIALIVVGALYFLFVSLAIAIPTFLGVESAHTSLQQFESTFDELGRHASTFGTASQQCEQTGESVQTVRCLARADASMAQAMSQYAATVGGITFPADDSTAARAAQAAGNRAAGQLTQASRLGSDPAAYSAFVQAPAFQASLNQVDTTARALVGQLQGPLTT